MAETVHLVLGADPVTAWLREQIWSSRERMVEAGLAFPPGGPARQRAAVADLVGQPAQGRPATWGRLVARVAAGPRTCVLVAGEQLHGAGPVVLERLVASLAPAAVHVLHPVAPPALAGALAWQQQLRAGATATFADWVASAPQPQPTDTLAPLLDLLPRDRVHLVAGSSLESVAARTGELLGAGGALQPEAADVLLPAIDAEVLRRYNLRLRERAGAVYADPGLRASIVDHRLVGPAFRWGPVIELPPLPDAESWWEQLRTLATRVHLVGDLDELAMVPTATEPAPEELLEAGLRLWVRQLEVVDERLDRALVARRQRLTDGGDDG